MIILYFKIENVQRISVVEAYPDGSMVTVAGENAQGKTSTLDSIVYALGGKRTLPPQPVRKGEKEARIQIQLGDDRDVDLGVTCVIRSDGYYHVEVTTKDGAKLRNVREMLDRLIGPISLDPSEFALMGRTPEGRREQLRILKELVGLDFTALDEKRQALYDERQLVNHQADELKGQIAGLTQHEDAPPEEVNIVDLSAKLEMALTSHRKAENALSVLEAAESKDKAIQEALQGTLNQIADLKEQIRFLEEQAKDQREAIDRAKVEVTNAKHHSDQTAKAVIDLEPIRKKIAMAEETNRKVRENRALIALRQKQESAQKKSQSFTNQILQIDAEKAQQTQAAKFPVPGLGFNAETVLFNDLPFEQASHEEKIRVGMAIRFALNPKARIVLIREADHFDQKHLALIEKMAKEKGGQLLCERQLRPGDKAGKSMIILEDGTNVPR